MADAPLPEDEAGGEQHVLAVVFDKATRADEALLTLVHLGQEGGIDMADAVVVAKLPDGKTHVRQTVDPTPGRAAIGGAWLGTLVGLLFGGPLGGAVAGAAGAALYAKLVDTGLDDGWVKQMAEWLDPGTSALLLLLNDDGLRSEAIEELQRFDGQLVTTTFPDSVRRAIEEELEAET
jgi:uncharacterized membrane protein